MTITEARRIIRIHNTKKCICGDVLCDFSSSYAYAVGYLDGAKPLHKAIKKSNKKYKKLYKHLGEGNGCGNKSPIKAVD